MRAVKGKLSRAAIAQIRRERTTASDRYRIGGKLKERHRPKQITLPKLRCLEERKPWQAPPLATRQSEIKSNRSDRLARGRGFKTPLPTGG
jgi:hypothetical protein